MSIDNVSGISSNTGNVNGGRRTAGSGATETGRSIKGNSNPGRNEFLRLLMAQLKSRDPMSSQQDGEFIIQLAQFSTVEGMQSPNKSMESTLSNYRLPQTLQVSSLVGWKVIVTTDKSVVDTKDTFKTSLNLSVFSSNVWVNAYSDKDTVVNRTNLGQQTADSVSFMWDGRDSSGNIMPPGTYKFGVQTSIDDKAYGFQTYLSANVDSVALGQNDGELMLNLVGLSNIMLSKVRIIGQ